MKAKGQSNGFKPMAGSVQPAAQTNGGAIYNKGRDTKRNAFGSSDMDTKDQKLTENGFRRATKKKKRNGGDINSLSTETATNIVGNAKRNDTRSSKVTTDCLANVELKAENTDEVISKSTPKKKVESSLTGKPNNPTSATNNVIRENESVRNIDGTGKVKKKASNAVQDGVIRKGHHQRSHNYKTMSEKKVKMYTARAQSKGMTLDEYMNRRIMKKEKIAKKT